MFTDYFCQKGWASCKGSCYLRFMLSGMARGRGEGSSDEDPWKIPALTTAFLELLLSILLLLGAVITWITFRFVKSFGLEPPCSYIGCTHLPRPRSSKQREFYAHHMCGFCMSSLCSKRFSPHSCSIIGLGNYTVTEDCAGDISFATSSAPPGTSHFIRGASVPGDDGASEGHINLVDTFNGSRARNLHNFDGAGSQSWSDIDTKRLLCSYCRTPLRLGGRAIDIVDTLPSSTFAFQNFLPHSCSDGHSQPQNLGSGKGKVSENSNPELQWEVGESPELLSKGCKRQEVSEEVVRNIESKSCMKLFQQEVCMDHFQGREAIEHSFQSLSQETNIQKAEVEASIDGSEEVSYFKENIKEGAKTCLEAFEWKESPKESPSIVEPEIPHETYKEEDMKEAMEGLEFQEIHSQEEGLGKIGIQYHLDVQKRAILDHPELLEGDSTGKDGARKCIEDIFHETHKEQVSLQDHQHEKQSVDGAFVENDRRKGENAGCAEGTGRDKYLQHFQGTVVEEAEMGSDIPDIVNNSQQVGSNEDGKKASLGHFVVASQREKQVGDGWELSIDELSDASEQEENTYINTRNGTFKDSSELAQQEEDGAMSITDCCEGDQHDDSFEVPCVDHVLSEPHQERSKADTEVFPPEVSQSQLKEIKAEDKEEAVKVFVEDVHQMDKVVKAEGRGESDSKHEGQEISIEIVTGENSPENYLQKGQEENIKFEMETEELVLDCKHQNEQDDERADIRRELSLPGFDSQNQQGETSEGKGMEKSIEGFPKITRQEECIEDHHGRSEQEEADRYSEEIDREDVVDALRDALQVERNALSALYRELEEERNAAAIAASEAMAMISRLQEEKAMMQMEAAQYHRMAEEKAIYDQEAMSLLKDILLKRDQEKFELEKEVEMYQDRLLREKVEKMKRVSFNRPNDGLAMDHRVPALLMERNVGDFDLSSEILCNGQGAETDCHEPGFEWKIPNGEHNYHSLGPVESMEENPNKRFNNLPLGEDDVKQGAALRLNSQGDNLDIESRRYTSIFTDTLVESNSGHYTTGEEDGFGLGLEGLLPGEQLIDNAVRSVSNADDEDTCFVLEHLGLLEEKLRGLSDEGDYLRHSKADSKIQGIEFEDRSSEEIALSARSLQSSKKPVVLSTNSRVSIANLYPQTMRKGTGKDFCRFRLQGSAFCTSPNLTECYGDITEDISCPWNQQREESSPLTRPTEEVHLLRDGLLGGEVLPLHDVYEVHNGLRNSKHCSMVSEGIGSHAGTGDRLGKPDFSPEGILSAHFKRMQDGSRYKTSRKLFSGQNALSSSPVEKVNGKYQISKDSRHFSGEWLLGAPLKDLHKSEIIPIGKLQNMTQEQTQELATRVQVLEADRELLTQALQSLKNRDTGNSLLQEIAANLRELRMVDRKAVDTQGLLQMEPLFTSSLETYTPTIKKRRCWSGSPPVGETEAKS